MITLYSRNNCSQCQLAKQWLTNHHVDFEEVDIDSNQQLILKFLNEGYRQLPIITNGTKTISGFDATEIQSLLDK